MFIIIIHDFIYCYTCQMIVANIQKCIKHLASYFFIFVFEHCVH